MRVILGIGNPGKRYSQNRHNAGFMQLDQFAGKSSLSFSPSIGDYYFCKGKIGQSEFSLIKPATYVNNSGIAALQALQFYGADVSDLLVVYDDINLEFSTIKVKATGSDGGHNGVSSIIYHLQSDMFPRIRIGIGNNFEKGFMADYVLSDFSKEEFSILDSSFSIGNSLIEEFIRGGVKQLLDANSRISQMNSKNKNNSNS